MQIIFLKAFPAVISELDLVEEEDQITHTVTLDDAQDPENTLSNRFFWLKY